MPKNTICGNSWRNRDKFAYQEAWVQGREDLVIYDVFLTETLTYYGRIARLRDSRDKKWYAIESVNFLPERTVHVMSISPGFKTRRGAASYVSIVWHNIEHNKDNLLSPEISREEESGLSPSLGGERWTHSQE